MCVYHMHDTIYIHIYYIHPPQFAGEVKSHNVCKRHSFLDTGFKQAGPSPFPQRYPNGIKQNEQLIYKFEETVSKLSVNSGNHNLQDSYKNEYPDPVLNFG